MFDTEAYIMGNIESHPVEARIIRRVCKALKDAGHPVTAVFDGEETTPTKTTQDVLMTVFNLDEAYLRVKGGGYVFVVMGEGWDTVADYTVKLEDTLSPVMDWVSANY